MSDLNMDNKKFPNATTPQLEFTLPKAEVDGGLEIGQIGTITIPVEVVEVGANSVSFRKRKKAEVGPFRQASLQDMEEDIGVAER